MHRARRVPLRVRLPWPPVIGFAAVRFLLPTARRRLFPFPAVLLLFSGVPGSLLLLFPVGCAVRSVGPVRFPPARLLLSNVGYRAAKTRISVRIIANCVPPIPDSWTGSAPVHPMKPSPGPATPAFPKAAGLWRGSLLFFVATKSDLPAAVLFLLSVPAAKAAPPLLLYRKKQACAFRVQR